MKLLKSSAVALLAILGVAAVVGALRTPVWQVEVQVEIVAPSALIHEHIIDFHRWSAWAGWNNDADPEVKFTYGGAAKGEGATWAWDGPEMGHGRMLITKADPATGVWLDEAIESEEFNAKGSLTYTDLGDGRTLVTWRDEGRLPPIIGGLLRDMLNDYLSAHFSKGLAALKALAEVEHAQAQRSIKTQVFGSVHGVMMMRDWSAKAKLGDLDLVDAVGVGALADLKGEITISAGQVFVAHSLEQGARFEHSVEPTEDAALLVLATVPKWRASVLSSAVDLKGLGAIISARASQAQLPMDKPIPFRLRGQMVSANWHVINGAKIAPDLKGHQAHVGAGHQEVRNDFTAEIVGFYAPNGAGTITHHGNPVHAHIVVPEDHASGHLDAAQIGEKAVLMLPDTRP
jgi:hypothetical protein